MNSNDSIKDLQEVVILVATQKVQCALCFVLLKVVTCELFGITCLTDEHFFFLILAFVATLPVFTFFMHLYIYFYFHICMYLFQFASLSLPFCNLVKLNLRKFVNVSIHLEQMMKSSVT